MIEALYQKIKITERSLCAGTILRLRLFATLVFLLTPVFTILKFTDMLTGLGSGFEWAVSIGFVVCLFGISFSRLANMLVFTDKRLDEWEIRLKKRAEAFAYRCTLFSIMALAFVFSFQWEALTMQTFSYAEILFLPMTIFFYLVVLPILYVAWTQKPLDT